ncbi:hypothetical protein D9M71_595440 [compost metagenome]
MFLRTPATGFSLLVMPHSLAILKMCESRLISRFARTFALRASRYWAITCGVIASSGALSNTLRSCLSDSRLSRWVRGFFTGMISRS